MFPVCVILKAAFILYFLNKMVDLHDWRIKTVPVTNARPILVNYI